MSERIGSVSRTAAFAVVMAAVMLMGMPTLDLGGGKEFSAVGSADAIDVPRNFILGVGELTADSLNTNTATMVSEYLLIFYCYSYLVGYDVDMNIVGDLATSWEVSPDGLTWHFELVDNAYFCNPANPTDLSHPVTAADVVYSFWELQNHSSGRLYGYFPGIIDHFDYDVNDPYWFTLYLNKIHAPIMESFLATPILPRYYWEGSGDDFLDFNNLPPIGSGPLYYATQGLPTTGSAELRRNPIWFQTENKGWQLHTDSWFIEEHTSVTSALMELEAGTLDCYMRIPSSDYLGLWSEYENVIGFSQSAGFVYEYNLNQMTDIMRATLKGSYTPGENNQLLLDPTVKTAMAMAVNKDYFVNDILLGLGSYADSLIPPQNPGHYWIPDPLEFDLPAARQMLWDAGWRYDATGAPATSTTCPLAKVGGTDVLSFRFYTLDTSVVWENAAIVMVEWAEDIGVELNMELKTVSEMNSIWYSADYDVWLWDWVMGVTADPSGILEVLTTMSIGASSDVYWSDATYDALYNLSLATVDPATRQDIHNEMQTMAYWNLGCQCVAYSNDNYGVSTVNWAPESLGDWNTSYFLLPDISAQWPSMQMYPDNNHAPYFTGYTGQTGVVIAEKGVSESFLAGGLDDDPMTPLEFRWFWGDGQKTDWSSSGAATHTYMEDGIYEVWVAIREGGSSNGYEDYFVTCEMATVEVYDMANDPPENVDFTWDPLAPDAGTYVVFTGTATDPEGDDLYFTWDFGDGHMGSGEVVEHQFGAEDTYTVTLSVTDNRLGHGTRPTTESHGIYIAANQPPSLSVPDFPDIPVKQTRSYTVSASDPENSMEFTWFWGDGAVSVTTTPTASHAYNVRGTYTLTVWADDLTGLDGHNVSDSGYVYVFNPQANKVPVVSGFSLDDSTPSTWQVVTFTGSGSDPDGDPLTFTFQFGDGTFYVESFGPNSGETLTVNVEHAYESTGAKTARLYISDGAANTSSTAIVVNVWLNYPPTLEPLPDITAYTGELVTVSVVTDDLDGDPLTYTWEWGDGTVDVTYDVPTASHTYTEPLDGVYWVHVDDGAGHIVTDGAFVTITEPTVPTFTLELVVGWNLVTVPFVNHGYTAGTLGLAHGDTVASFNPATGTYDKTFIVGVYPPILDFALLPLTGYWVYANAVESIELTGEEPTSTVSRSITVGGGGGWALVGVPSLDETLLASEFAAMFSGGVSTVAAYNEVTHTYDKICIPGTPLDFVIVPGEGLWMYCLASGELSYDP